jgi:hypothetical protein
MVAKTSRPKYGSVDPNILSYDALDDPGRPTYKFSLNFWLEFMGNVSVLFHSTSTTMREQAYVLPIVGRFVIGRFISPMIMSQLYPRVCRLSLGI